MSANRFLVVLGRKSSAPASREALM
jgi:hypothetical protein